MAIALKLGLVVCLGLQILLLLRLAVDLAPLSWNNPLFRLIYETSEPLLRPGRRYGRLPILGWCDLSFLLAFVGLLFIEAGIWFLLGRS